VEAADEVVQERLQTLCPGMAFAGPPWGAEPSAPFAGEKTSFEEDRALRIAAVSDIHVSTRSENVYELLAEAADRADVLLLCGDVTDRGLPDEAETLARELRRARIPVLAVMGNHDCESDHEQEIKKILADAGAHVLDGNSCEIDSVGFAGVKGFGGGFGRRALAAFGEQAMKAFVQESLNEMLKLETALSRLSSERRVVLLHYAPIQETVEGEPAEIFPFLGSSHLEEPLNRYEVSMAFHGHAHRGKPVGKTHTGIPVYNVAEPVLKNAFPGKVPLQIVEI
jgi:Icc-related predicted phosphoesterase